MPLLFLPYKTFLRSCATLRGTAVPKHARDCLVGPRTLLAHRRWSLCAVRASHEPENASIKNQQRPMYSIICRPTSLFRPSQQDTLSVTSWSMAHILLMPSRMYKCIDDGGARQHNTYTRSVFTYKHQAMITIAAMLELLHRCMLCLRYVHVLYNHPV